MNKKITNEKKEYTLIYTVLECQAFRIEAKDFEEAQDIATREYNEGNFALDNPTVILKSITLTSDNKKICEIKEDYGSPEGYGYPAKEDVFTAYIFETCVNEDSEAHFLAENEEEAKEKAREYFFNRIKEKSFPDAFLKEVDINIF